MVDTIIQGDCLDVMAGMDSESVDLVVTSPPYDNLRDYHGYTLDVPAMVCQFMRIIKPGGVIVWVVGDATINGSETGTSFRQALMFMDAGFNLHDTMIWDKASMRYPEHTRYYQCFEYMFVFSKGNPKTFNPICDRVNVTSGAKLARAKQNRTRDGRLTENSAYRLDKNRKRGDIGPRWNIWNVKVSASVGDKLALEHPATFSEPLAADHIISWSNEGDLVFDPMCGSGTTCKMAERLNRHWIGCDVSAEYCAIAEERIRIEKSQLKLDFIV